MCKRTNNYRLRNAFKQYNILLNIIITLYYMLSNNNNCDLVMLTSKYFYISKPIAKLDVYTKMQY